MTFSFPPVGHAVLETFCADQFEQVAARRSELKTIAELRCEARNGAVAVISYCLLSNDDIALVKCGVRGGKYVLWNFGGGVNS